MHCHRAAAIRPFLYPPESDSRGAPYVVLVILPTNRMRSGVQSVYEEHRIEQWLWDDVQTSFLGLVTVPST